MNIAKRMKGLKFSVGFELIQIAKKLKAQGEDVISLAIGELQEETYKPIRGAAHKAIEEGYTKYSPAMGREPLRKKISEQASWQFNLSLEPENVFVGNGCKYVLFCAFQTLCNPGDEVILPVPYWLSYPHLIEWSGAKVKHIYTKEENNFKITSQELKDNISVKTKALVLNSPNNPTGAIYSKEELKSLGEVLSSYPQVTLMVDAIYDRIVFSGGNAPHILSVCPHLKDQVLAFNGASKNYVMTGWRLGWLIGPKAFIKALSAFQSHSIGCANTISQRAFEDGFEQCEDHLKNIVKKLKYVRDLLTQGLKDIPGLKLFPSEGAFYLWLGIKNFLGKKHKGKTLTNSQDIMKQLLVEKKLICICGEEFGLPGYLRLSYVVDEKAIKKAVTRLQDFFKELV